MKKARVASYDKAPPLRKQKQGRLGGPKPLKAVMLIQEEEKKEEILIPAELMQHIDELSIKLREQGVDPNDFRQSCIDEYILLAKTRRYVNLKNMNGEQYAEWCKSVQSKINIEKINEASFEFDSWPALSQKVEAAVDSSAQEIDLSVQILGSVNQS